MEIVNLKTNELVPYENNARVHSVDQIEKLANSIDTFGFNVPILIDNNKKIIAGHGRVEAAKLLNLKEVPCILIDHLTDEEKKAYILADNKLSDMSTWDDTLLDLELLNLENIDMSEFGFPEQEVEFEEEEQKAKEKKQKNIESMELKAFEHYDYLVFVFDNQFDWMNACDEFGIHKVDAGYGETKKIGVGRVVKGTRLVEKLRHENNNS